MKIISITLLWLSISFCQTAKQSSGALNPNIGMSAGAYANAGTDKMEVDGFFEIQSSQGLFGEIWVMQLDRDAETTAEVNSTFGWMKEVAPNMILGGGFSNYANQNLNEIFMGGNIGLLTLIGFFGLEELPTNLLGILDLNIGPLKNIPVDLLMMNVSDEAGSDLFFMVKKTITKSIIAGYTFSRERFESEETRTFTKQGHTKSFTIPVQKDGFFYTIYIGVTF